MPTRSQMHSLWEHRTNINKEEIMKKELTLNEMYQLVLPLIRVDIREGLCVVMYNLLTSGTITRNQYERLCKHFNNQKPRKVLFGLITINKQFFKHSLYIGRTWWWEYESDIVEQQEQRRLFIEHLIKKTR